MRLRVEPPSARHESYSGARSAETAPSCLLGVVVQRQELSNWCWAAVAASLSEFFGPPVLRQEEIATILLGCDCTGVLTEPAVAESCNRRGSLEEALTLVGCYSHWSPGRPTFERVAAEICAGRPVGVALEWPRGGSHYILINGYHKETSEFYIQDPLHGPSLQLYHLFPSAYRGAGCVWRGTYWMKVSSLQREEKECRNLMSPLD